MDRKKELSIWGAIAICAVAVIIKHIFKLPWHNKSKVTGLKEDDCEVSI